MMRLAQFICLSILFGISTVCMAGQFRNYSAISTPEAAPPGFVEVSDQVPLNPGLVAQALQRLFDSWNSNELGEHVSEKFYNKSRLVDVIAQDIPRDARLRLLAVQGIQPLVQFATPANQTQQLIQTQVSAIARVQLEWNDLSLGYQRIEGAVEYVLDLTTRTSARTDGEQRR